MTLLSQTQPDEKKHKLPWLSGKKSRAVLLPKTNLAREFVCVCAQWRPTLCNPMDCCPPGSSEHRIFQARILEWLAISYSRGSSQPTQVSNPHLLYWQVDSYHWATWEALSTEFRLTQIASLIAQLVKNPPAMQEIPVWFLSREDPLEKG